MSFLALSFLGHFQVELDEQPITSFETDKVRALLAYLAVEADRSHSRAALATLLWPDAAETNSRINLRHVLHQLRKSIGDANATPSVLLITRQTLQFNLESDHHLDVALLRNALANCTAHAHADLAHCNACLQQLQDAIACYQGDFLADLSIQDSLSFEEWRRFKQEQFHLQALDTLVVLANAYESLGDDKNLRRYAARQLELEPWREQAHRQLIRVAVRSGQRAAALAQFAECKRVLDEELGVPPSEETIALYNQIRRGELVESRTGLSGQRVDVSGDPLEAEPSNGPTKNGSESGLHELLEMPAVEIFHGRAEEMALLNGWLQRGAGQAQLIALLGIGGQGKTAIATKAVQQNADQFTFVVWRSLLNAPPLDAILRGWLQTLSRQTITDLPESLDERINLLVNYLIENRVLLILDNMESILESGVRAGQPRRGYEDFLQLLQRLANSNHQSCLLLTSREQPQGVDLLLQNRSVVQTLTLNGLDSSASRAVLATHGLAIDNQGADTLTEHYSGNPLALQIVSDTIRDFFDADVAAFFADGTPLFDDIHVVLQEQIDRLSPLEREILFWLAIEREAVPPDILRVNLVQQTSQRALIEALRGLKRRSLLEKSAEGFLLQNVVIQYLTEILVERSCYEIESGQLDLLQSHALLKAQSKAYVQQSQARLLLHPIIERLTSQVGESGLATHARQLISDLQARPDSPPGYAAGNLLNLLLHMEVDISGYDFSGLSVWQASLNGANLSGVNFSNVNLRGTVFTKPFRAVNTIAFAPNGELVAAGDTGGTILLWRVANWQPIGLFSSHTGSIQSVAFSPDNQLLASSGKDNAIRLWHLATNTCQHTLTGHTNTVLSVTFGPNGELVASASEDHSVRLWNVQNGTIHQILEGHPRAVWSLAFSPDGKLLASTSLDRTIRVWDVATGETAQILQVPRSIGEVAFSPDGTMLAGGGWDRTVCIWRTEDWQIQHTLNGHERTIRTVAFSADSRWLASGDEANTIRVWHSHNGQLTRVLHGHGGWVSAVAFHPQSATLASASADQTVRIWAINSGQPLHVLSGYTSQVRSLDISPDDTLMVSGGEDAVLRLWDISTGDLICALPGHTGSVNAVIFSPDGKLVASSSWDQSVRIWDVHEQQLRHVFIGHSEFVGQIAFSPDSRLLASGSDDHYVKIWDLQAGALLHTLEHHATAVKGLLFSPDGTQLVSLESNRQAWVWDVTTREVSPLLASAMKQTIKFRAIGFDPNQTLVACILQDKELRFVDIGRWHTVSTLQGNMDNITWAVFSCDCRLVASSGKEQVIRVWDTQTGDCIHELLGHDGIVTALQFTKDSSRLVSSSYDATIKVWDLQTGICEQTLRVAGPYAGMNIADVTGISEAQKESLKALGSIEKKSLE